ncbi:MAG TPA: M48 family metallopeptidase [Candidatus Binataceae bacterium]|nr:M48 family metallopeptidase [Candidatus Binataceae bacterium]
MPAGSDFRALEARNRRDTIVLMAGFILLFLLLGCGFDFFAGTLRFRNGHLIGAPVFMVFALIFASVQSLISYFAGAPLILMSVHGQPLTPDTPKHQMVLNVIQEMALAARLPVPKAYFIPDTSPNAFATGRDPEHSIICVTQGLIDNMDREELQGVIGHEMSHIADYDIRTMMMVAVLVGGIAMLSDFMVRASFFRSSSRDSDRNGDGAIFVLILFVLAILAPFLSQVIAMAVSREREYLADASSVEFTRNPRALLRALKRIAETESPLKEGVRGTAHLFIVNPLASNADEDNDEGFFANLFSTHPPLRKRIERLQAMLGAAEPDKIAT